MQPRLQSSTDAKYALNAFIQAVALEKQMEDEYVHDILTILVVLPTQLTRAHH